MVVTPIALPIPQNQTFSVVTGEPDRAEMLNFLRRAHLNVMAEVNRNIAELFTNYFRSFSNSSCSFAVTYDSVRLPMKREVPERTTPFGHLNFLTSPVEGLYFDPDDVVET